MAAAVLFAHEALQQRGALFVNPTAAETRFGTSPTKFPGMRSSRRRRGALLDLRIGGSVLSDAKLHHEAGMEINGRHGYTKQ